LEQSLEGDRQGTGVSKGSDQGCVVLIAIQDECKVSEGPELMDKEEEESTEEDKEDEDDESMHYHAAHSLPAPVSEEGLLRAALHVSLRLGPAGRAVLLHLLEEGGCAAELHATVTQSPPANLATPRPCGWRRPGQWSSRDPAAWPPLRRAGGAAGGCMTRLVLCADMQ
jgi:hypothetical protein